MVRIRDDRNPDGSVDDLVIEDNGVMFHFEQMDRYHWWLALYTTDGVKHTINLRSKSRILASYEPEEVI